MAINPEETERSIIRGHLVSYHRHKDGFPQRTLAKLFNTQQPVISEIENGLPIPSELPDQIAKYLGLPPLDLDLLISEILAKRQLLFSESGILISARTLSKSGVGSNRFRQAIQIIYGPNELNGHKDYFIESQFGIFDVRNINLQFINQNPLPARYIKTQAILPFKYYEQKKQSLS